MIAFSAVTAHIAGLRADDVRRWVDNAWVRPLGPPGQWMFEEIDVARLRLIVELRDELRVDEEALPVVLSLLDQVHALRRQLVTVRVAMDQTLPADLRDSLLKVLERAHAGG